MEKKNKITRGFVTLATGKEKYYVLARNLLLSYRYHSHSPMPFAIICDEENEYTALFDKVIVLDNPFYSIYDKLRLPELVPYDENIFIEPDCLAYRNLNGMWKEFKGATDFSGLGMYLSLDDENGWLRRDGLGKYKDQVKEQFQMQGGVLFLRRGKLDSFSRTCMDIYNHRDEYCFRLDNEESIFVLSSLVHGFKPTKDWTGVFCYYPITNITEIDIKRGILGFTLKGFPFHSRPGIFLVHWGTLATSEEPYLSEAGKVVSLMERHKRASVFIPVRIMIERTLLFVKRTIIDNMWHAIKSFVPLPVKSFLWRLLVHRNS